MAAGKATMLSKAKAQVHVVAPKLDETLVGLVDEQSVCWHDRTFEVSDLDGKFLVIAATDDAELNASIVRRADELGILANSASDGTVGNFIMPAVVDRAPLVAAISTGGASPVLARMMRARIESVIPPAFGHLAALSREFRDAVKLKLPTGPQRREFWDRIFSGPVAELVFNGRLADAREKLEQTLEEPARDVGEVYLIGAGPGDSELLSLKALRLIQQADVVVYDRLVSKPILDLVRRDAKKVYAGKQRANHALQQQEINSLLVELAQTGQRVARLKGGDPFIFGRGGEEIAELVDAHIPFQVVPAVTAASGCAAYAGIPLTHRDHAHACVFVTGNLVNGEVDMDWSALARPMQTIVVYMGLVGLKKITAGLIQHGLPASTPVALVEKGTTPEQRVLEGTLETLPQVVADGSPKPPTLLIIGEVVRLRSTLKWFGNS